MTRCWNASISGGGFKNEIERLEKVFELYA